jgi:hypothetical protein
VIALQLRQNGVHVWSSECTCEHFWHTGAALHEPLLNDHITCTSYMPSSCRNIYELRSSHRVHIEDSKRSWHVIGQERDSHVVRWNNLRFTVDHDLLTFYISPDCHEALDSCHLMCSLDLS